MARFPRGSAVLAALSLLGGVGCVSSDDIEGLHGRLNEIEKEIQSLERKSSSKEEVARLNQSVSQQTTQLLKSNADTGIRLGELTTQMERLEAKLEDTNRRLAQLSQQIAETQTQTQTQGDLSRMRQPGTVPGAAPDDGAPPDATVAGGPRPSPQELYDAAYADYTKGRYALAIQGFQEYLDLYPNTDVSDNAQYWIGESHYAQKKHREAIADFQKLQKSWPKSDKAAAALLKRGYSLLELGQKADGVVQLQYVIHEHPTSEEARLARTRLRTIGVEAR